MAVLVCKNWLNRWDGKTLMIEAFRQYFPTSRCGFNTFYINMSLILFSPNSPYTEKLLCGMCTRASHCKRSKVEIVIVFYVSCKMNQPKACLSTRWLIRLESYDHKWSRRSWECSFIISARDSIHLKLSQYILYDTNEVSSVNIKKKQTLPPVPSILYGWWHCASVNRSRMLSLVWNVWLLYPN